MPPRRTRISCFQETSVDRRVTSPTPIRVGVISVPIAPKNAADYEFALDSGTWGSRREPDAADTSVPQPHDVLLIATGYQRLDPETAKGTNSNPRIDREIYNRGTIGVTIAVEVTGPMYTSNSPHWPGEDGSGGIRYPYRFPITPLGTGRNIAIEDFPPELHKFFHLSIRNGSRPSVAEVQPEHAQKLAELLGSASWEDLISSGPDTKVDYIDPFDVLYKESPKNNAGSGRQQNPKKRKEIELHAEDEAVKHYENLGWTVKRIGAPYDLKCTRGDEYLRVEVKGTTGAAGEVELTVNEVTSAREHPSELFVVSDISARPSEDGEDDGGLGFVATGGRAHVLHAWEPLEDDLSATRYCYRLPQDQAESFEVE